MTDISQVKLQRTIAKGKFTRKLNYLSSLLESNAEVFEIDAGFTDLNDAWKGVEQKHDAYVEASTDEDNTTDKWIESVEVEFLKVRKAVLAYRISDTQKKLWCKHDRSFKTYEKDFNDTVKRIYILVNEPCSVETINAERRVLISVFEKLKGAYIDYVTLLTDDDSVALSSNMDECTERYNSVRSSIDQYIMSKKKDESSKSTLFHMEKMPLPKFDGSIRNYPQFKKDFTELVLPSVGKNESSYILRQCLARDVNDYLGSCTVDVEEMLDRLDLKYGDPSKIVESIVADIRRFKRPDDDEYEKIVQFVNLVEIGYRDLKELELEDELTNTNTISVIENKLPKRMQMEWYRLIHREAAKIDKKYKFNHLLKFMREERNAIEYATSDIRKSKVSPYSTSDIRKSKVSPYSNVLTVESNVETCIIHFWSTNHSTADCRTFHNLNINNKLDVLKEKNACHGCLISGHSLAECKVKKKCDVGSGCLKYHHSSLHVDSKNGTATALRMIDTDHDIVDYVLLPIMKVEPESKRCKYLSCLWDSAADISLITNSKANQMRLKGKPAKLSVTVAGGQKSTIDSLEYSLTLRDTDRKLHTIKVYGIEKITNEIGKLELKDVVKQFEGITPDDIDRPEGELNLLIGYDYAGWHPVVEKSNGHLVLLGNIFGKCIGGRCPYQVENTKGSVVGASVNLIKKDGISSEFLTIESLGVQCDPKCGNCKCGSCPIGGKSYSIKEERELKLIEDNLEFKGTHWEARYPWIQRTRPKSIERDLSRDRA